MKTLRALLLLAMAVLLVRSTWLAGLATRGIWLDVCALATVLWALRHGASWGAGFGFLMGLAADLDAGAWLGRHALALSLIGHGVGELSRTLVRDSWRTQSALFLAAAALHQLFVLLIESMRAPVPGLYWAQRVAISSAITAAAGVGLLALLRQLRGRALYDDVPDDSLARR